MRKLLVCLTVATVLFSIHSCLGQPPSFTANDVVPHFDGHFGYGANLGYYPPDYYDEQLAILAKGSPDGKVPGVGVTTIRPALFEHFLDYWGYDIRLNTFKLYDSIGLKDNVVFIGYPSEQHRDVTPYCLEGQSEVFKNMYTPIWDDGENGTPVNDTNFYALYLWKMVNVYKPYVKFWEITNEPDLDLKANAWKPADMPGNWWTNIPDPCEMALRAPVTHYVRMLRISYEVIKSVDPTAYVAIGGIGYPSFLDLVCRLSDNPNKGVVTTQYPKKGGAYFDVLSYHSYPHIENAMREWDNRIAGFRYFRHTDAAVDGIWTKKTDFQHVLNKYGYNGKTYPEKKWIITEINIPRKQFGDFLGSDAAQTNFMMKALITAQANDLLQIHIYSLADAVPESKAENEFAFMGLFENLENVKPFAGRKNQVAIGFKTTSDLLYRKTFDSTETARLQLPPNVRGAAFRDANDKLTYALWATTNFDRNEAAIATYAFPNELGIKYLEQKNWHYSRTGARQITNAKQVVLDASPAFFTPLDLVENDYPKTPKVLPNPVSGGYAVYSFWQYEKAKVTIEVFDSTGRLVQTLASDEERAEGAHQILLEWPTFAAGTYFIRLKSGDTNIVVPAVKI